MFCVLFVVGRKDGKYIIEGESQRRGDDHGESSGLLSPRPRQVWRTVVAVMVALPGVSTRLGRYPPPPRCQRGLAQGCWIVVGLAR